MAPNPNTRGNVLICDDDADAREVATAWLKSEGYDVCAVSGYEELRHLLVSLEPDAIVLDICMPEYDGFQVAESLRMLGERAPIIFLTAYDSRERRENAEYVTHVSGYLKKPYDPQALLKTIEAAIRNRPPSVDAT